MRSPRFARLALGLTILAIGGSPRAENETPPPPLDPGLAEGIESRLVQFELRAARKGVPVRGLSAKDLDIELGGKPVTAFTVDDMCAEAPQGTSARVGSFLFYFDESQLTVEGRRRAIEVARRVSSSLLSQGQAVFVLRNGPAQRAETTWTRDPALVTAALDRIASDSGSQESARAEAEETRAENTLERAASWVRETDMSRQLGMSDAENALLNALGGGGPLPTATMARVRELAKGQAAPYSAEGDAAEKRLIAELTTLVEDQLRRGGRDIERLRAAVRSLSLRGSPKGVVYFSDTLRRDPGGAAARALESTRGLADRKEPTGSRSALTAQTEDAALTALVRDASSYGVRFYAVEGRGLASPSDWVRTSQDTLVSLALDTGGLSFVNGLSGAAIAESVAADQACWYLVSFAPSGWEEDRTLPLAVYGKQPGLRVKTGSSLVIPSRATLTQTRLIAAHFGDASPETLPLSVSIYPVGGTAKNLTVLAQVRLPDGATPQSPDTSWDVGFEVVSQGVVVAKTSSRVGWRGSGRPPVCQATLTIPSGLYEIVAVARDVSDESIRQGRASGAWPASTADRVTLSVPAIAQPQRGGIVQDGEVKASGIVVRGSGELVDPGAPVAIVTAACVGGSSDAVLRAERSIAGETVVPFATMELASDGGRCVQIRDLVAAGSLGAGRLTYVVRILSGDVPITSQQLVFDVAEVAPPSAVQVAQ